jgi:hypothetical protein
MRCARSATGVVFPAAFPEFVELQVFVGLVAAVVLDLLLRPMAGRRCRGSR